MKCGILSLQKHANDIYSIANSNGEVNMVTISTDNKIIIEKPIACSDDSILYHDIAGCQAVCGTYDGNLLIVDLETDEVVNEPTKAHDFSVWYTSYSSADCDIIYSAADDGSFKKFDTRVGLATPVYQNRKHHTAGVTFVRQLD